LTLSSSEQPLSPSRILAPNHPFLSKVGYDVSSSQLTKVPHKIPMGSLDKAMNREEFFKWVYKTVNALDLAGASFLPLTASLKADGGSCSAGYSRSLLQGVLTRGDGIIGEDVRLNGFKFQCLPHSVAPNALNRFDGCVRFEGVMLVHDWMSIDPDQLSNPRNKANGLGRRKDAEQADLVTAQAFRIHGSDGKSMGTCESENMQQLEALGFNTVPWITGTADEVWTWIEVINKKRPTLPFWIDGIVVKVDSFERQHELGEATDFPKWAVAVKFEPEVVTTTVLGVDITVGHTGAIIPTAIRTNVLYLCVDVREVWPTIKIPPTSERGRDFGRTEFLPTKHTKWHEMKTLDVIDCYTFRLSCSFVCFVGNWIGSLALPRYGSGQRVGVNARHLRKADTEV
jgi:NAD-dependent DNA ligase